MATNSSSAEHEKDLQGSYRSSRSASIAMETEAIASTSTLNRFITGIRSQRRRFSRTGDGVNNLALEIGNENSNSLSNHESFKSPNLPGPSKNLQWTPSTVGFNLVDESPSEIVSYAMNSDNVVIASSETGRSGIHHHHSGSSMNGTSSSKIKKLKVSDNEHSHGSFFLRAGAVAFGLGTMIYDGLEFGAFLEVPRDSPCFALLRGINPVLHAAFVFLQMYFIFISARVFPFFFHTFISAFDSKTFSFFRQNIAQHSQIQSNRPFWINALSGNQCVCVDSDVGPRIAQGNQSSLRPSSE